MMILLLERFFTEQWQWSVVYNSLLYYYCYILIWTLGYTSKKIILKKISILSCRLESNASQNLATIHCTWNENGFIKYTEYCRYFVKNKYKPSHTSWQHQLLCSCVLSLFFVPRLTRVYIISQPRPAFILPRTVTVPPCIWQ